MKLSPSSIARALYHKFVVSPRGGGRPVPKEALDREYSSGQWDHFQSWEELPRNLLLAGVVRHQFPMPAVLDIGCGDGRLARLYQDYPFESYLGLDLSTEGLSRARALNLAKTDFVQGDFETWTTDRTFDAIVFNECIGYAVDPGALVGRLSAYLRKDGRLFISCFRFGNWEAIWRRVGTVATVEAATSIVSPEGKTWDVKVLRPSAETTR